MDIHTALNGLERLRAGEASLDADGFAALCDAVAACAQALANHPRGEDPVALGIWHNGERNPALARLADAVTPQRSGVSAVEELQWIQHEQRAAALALAQVGDVARAPRTGAAGVRRPGRAGSGAALRTAYGR